MKKLTIIFIIVFVILSSIIVFNIYKPHKDISTSTEDYSINSKEIYKEFTDNEDKALKLYSNKVILSSGVITDIDEDDKTIIIDSVLFYQFDELSKNKYKINQKIKIKARLVGYDDLMNEIKLDQSTVIL